MYHVARLPKIWVVKNFRLKAPKFLICLFKGSLNYGCKSHVVGVRAICVDGDLSSVYWPKSIMRCMRYYSERKLRFTTFFVNKIFLFVQLSIKNSQNYIHYTQLRLLFCRKRLHCICNGGDRQRAQWTLIHFRPHSIRIPQGGR